jgi:DNA polymerase-3 subunit alpha
LGFYLSSHPLAEFAATLTTYCSHGIADLPRVPHRSEVIVGGMMAAIKLSQTKNPRPGATHTKYAMFDLEDMTGLVRCILWPEEYANFGTLVESDAIRVVRGVIDRRPGSEETNLIVNELIPLEDMAGRFTKGVVIRIDEGQHTREDVVRLREILRGYPGTCDLQFVVLLADGSKVFMRTDTLRVALDPEMLRRVDELLGAGNLRLQAAPPKPAAAPRGNHGQSRYSARR